MAGITSAGLGSGLDIEGLVSSLVSAEGKAPSLRLAKKEAKLQADLSALGAFKSSLGTFQSTAAALKDSAAFQTRKATTSHNDLFSVSASGSAGAGSFSLRVDQLAQAAKVRSADFVSDTAVMGAGSLAISLGATSFSVTVGATTTLAGVRDAINSASGNPGVRATIVKADSGHRLILTSDKVGLANTISVVATDTNGSDGGDLTRLDSASLVTMQPATDAIIQVDGQTATKDSNSFSDVISGVTITLKKADVATTATLTVAQDKEAVRTKVNDFVTAYNTLAGTLKNLSSYNAETKQAAQLFGDTTVQGAKSQIRQAIATPVSGLAGFGTLAEMGIKTNKSGALEIDSTKFNRAMDNNFESVAQLFSSSDGVAKRLDTALTSYTSSTGSLVSRVNSVNKQIGDIGEQRTKLNARLTQVEARYRKQFTAMDSLVGGLQATGSYLTQQLANLPGFVEKSNN